MRISPETNCLAVKVDQALVPYCAKAFLITKAQRSQSAFEVDLKMLSFVFFVIFVVL
jgi:hypothetical protein